MVRNILWSTAVAGCVAVAGFGSACAKSNSDEAGQGVCATTGMCANDGTPSQSAIDACNTQITGTCGSEYSSYFTCLKTNATCSSAGVSQAPPSSTCASENGALSQCLGGGGTDGGSTGTDGGGTTYDSGTQTFDSGSTGNDTGTTTNPTYCTDIVNCTNSCTDQSCADACVAMGTSTAQSDFDAVVECLFGTDGMSGACGAMCGTETTACDDCLMSAQASGGACYAQVGACAMDTTRTLPPVRNPGALPSAN